MFHPLDVNWFAAREEVAFRSIRSMTMIKEHEPSEPSITIVPVSVQFETICSQNTKDYMQQWVCCRCGGG